MRNGWIVLHRKLLEWAYAEDPYYMALWVRMLLMATHKPIKKVFGRETITVQPGQFITSRCSLAAATGCSESKIERMLTRLETEHQIGQRACSVSRLITISKWNEYQSCEQRDEQQSDSERTASGQRADTNNKVTKEQGNKESTPAAQRPAKAPAAPAWKWWIEVNRACGLPDPVAVGKDTAASRTIAKAVPVEAECKEIMRRYLRDTDQFLTKTGYPLSFLLQRINRYRNAPGGATAAQPSQYKQLGETA